MSATGLDVFDRTLEITHTWLDEIMQDLGPDRQVAWKVLTAVLHRLRDRLPLGLAVNLGAQLPLLVRGVYYDQFQPAKLPTECDSREEFVAEVAKWLSDIRPVDPDSATLTVFKVLSHHCTPDLVANVREALPKTLREAWERAAPVEPLEA